MLLGNDSPLWNFIENGSIETRLLSERRLPPSWMGTGKNCWHTIESITKKRIEGQWMSDIKTARDRQKAENGQHVC